MNFDRKKFKWTVELEGPDGKTYTEKVESYWSPDFEGVKEAIALAGRMKAWFRNKKKIEFLVKGDPKLVTD